MKKLEIYQRSEDKRGFLWGIVNSGEWKEINYVETVQNEIRGGHYHKHTEELFFIISGVIEVTVRNLQNEEFHSFVAEKGDVFIVEPYELHEFRCLETSKWINVLSKAFDVKQPDFWKV
jgi:Uncharacterized conserved protein, contains double-stranded beta-helix domain